MSHRGQPAPRIVFVMAEASPRPVGGAKTTPAERKRTRRPHPWYKSAPGFLDLLLPGLEVKWITGHYDFVIATNQRGVARVRLPRAATHTSATMPVGTSKGPCPR